MQDDSKTKDFYVTKLEKNATFNRYSANVPLEKVKKELKGLLWGSRLSTHITDTTQRGHSIKHYLTDTSIAPARIQTNALQPIGIKLKPLHQ